MIGTEYSLFDPFSGLTDSLVNLLKLIIIAVVLVGIGLLLLANKLPVVPKPWSLIAGFGLIALALYVIWKGGF